MNKPFVLVVEDNEIQRKVIRLLATEFGFDCVLTANCEDALKAFAAGEDRFNLVLMDLRLPDGNGEQCAAKLRQMQNGGPRKVPIVAMTGYIDVNDRQRCVEMGFDDCLIKPFSSKELRDMVSRWAKPDYNVLPFRESGAFRVDGGGQT
jgi:CheY-like chemotaxis protein